VSWDVYVQDIPADVSSVGDIPDDFNPRSLGPRAEILRAIRAVLPFADYSDDSWVQVNLPEISMEISIGKDDPVDGFAFHVRGGALSGAVIAEILVQLGARAIDPQAENGLFDVGTAERSLARWQEYKAAVISSC